LLSRETAIRVLARDYDIDDAAGELGLVDRQQSRLG